MNSKMQIKCLLLGIVLGAGVIFWIGAVTGSGRTDREYRVDSGLTYPRAEMPNLEKSYFGFLVAVVGMVLVLGEVRAFALLFGVEVLFRKMGQEETVLRTAFPNQYPEYERRVKRLLPWIW